MRRRLANELFDRVDGALVLRPRVDARLGDGADLRRAHGLAGHRSEQRVELLVERLELGRRHFGAPASGARAPRPPGTNASAALRARRRHASAASASARPEQRRATFEAFGANTEASVASDVRGDGSRARHARGSVLRSMPPCELKPRELDRATRRKHSGNTPSSPEISRDARRMSLGFRARAGRRAARWRRVSGGATTRRLTVQGPSLLCRRRCRVLKTGRRRLAGRRNVTPARA